MAEQGVRVLGNDTVDVVAEGGPLAGQTLKVRTIKRSERIKLMDAVGGNLDSDAAKMKFAVLAARLAIPPGTVIDPRNNLHFLNDSKNPTGLWMQPEEFADMLTDETLGKVLAAAMGQQVSEAQAGN